MWEVGGFTNASDRFVCSLNQPTYPTHPPTHPQSQFLTNTIPLTSVFLSAACPRPEGVREG